MSNPSTMNKILPALDANGLELSVGDYIVFKERNTSFKGKNLWKIVDIVTVVDRYSGPYAAVTAKKSLGWDLTKFTDFERPLLSTKFYKCPLTEKNTLQDLELFLRLSGILEDDRDDRYD